jgi:hypothetical protein
MSFRISNAGEKREQLAELTPVNGAVTRTQAPLWIEHDGMRLRVARHVQHWVGFHVLGHQSVSASGFECMMSDGSTWLLVHDLMDGSWFGGPMGAELAA